MKNLILVFVAFLSSINMNAQTIVDSNIETNTVWVKANSPYLVLSRITINENISLTIEPGVVIKKSGSSDLMQLYGMSRPEIS